MWRSGIRGHPAARIRPSVGRGSRLGGADDRGCEECSDLSRTGVEKVV